MASKGSKGRAKAKGSVAASADSGGAASAAGKQDDIAHKLYKQLKKRMAVAQMVPEADKLVSPQHR